MDLHRWRRVQTIFHDLADLSYEEQQAALYTVCSGDSDLISEVSRLLEGDLRGTSILDKDLADVACYILDSPHEFPPQDFGPYRLKSILGEGGMGVVYLAERKDVGGQVAIKVLRDAPLSPWRRERFAREEGVLAGLSHPNIARLYDARSFDDGTPWFVMEYVQGQHLTGYCRERTLSIRERLELFRSVCEAVQYAHANAIIHRDLKPSNILVEERGTVKLLDFGIALQLEKLENPAGRTRTGAMFMTPVYTAPERFRGESGGIQSDVYSLGVILYELLTDRLPFDLSDQTPGQAEITISGQAVPAPSAIARLERKNDPSKPVWSDLDVLCLTAMHRDSLRRYASVEALARDVGHYLRGRPLEARPDSLRYRAGKFWSRNRRLLSATAAAVAIIIALAGFFAVRLARERKAERAEEARTQKIQQFMLSLFDGGDHDVRPAAGLRVATLLERGVHEAQTLNAEPQTQAALLETLGNIYLNMEQFERAETVLKLALERSRSAFGPGSRQAADALLDLGLVSLQQGKPKEAEDLIRRGLALDERSLPHKDPAITKGMLELGIVMLWRGSYKDAVDTLEKTVRQASSSDVTPDWAADAVTGLAVAHYYLGHLETAESLDRQALSMHEHLYGSAHPKIADDYYNLGTVSADTGHWGPAEDYFRKALAIKESWYGDNNVDTAVCMMAVARALSSQKRFDEAGSLLERSVAIQESLLGKSNPRVATVLNALGTLDVTRGHLDEAEKIFRRMEAINRATYGDDNYSVGAALFGLGEVYFQRREYPLAEGFYRGALQRYLPAHRNVWLAQQRLGRTLTLERQYKNAEPYLLAVRDALGKQTQGSAQTEALANAQADLATVFAALGKADVAN